MKDQKPHIAILSPNRNAYSETFIQAHKRLSDFRIFYYYGSPAYPEIEGKGPLLSGLGKILAKALGILQQQSPDNIGKKALLRSWKKHQIKLILAEYGHTAAACIDAIATSGLPLIVHFHGYDATVKSLLEEYKTAYLKMFAYATYVIAVSRAMEKQLLALGCPKEKLVNNVYGPNEFFFDVQPAFTQKRLISIGRFTNKKAPYYHVLAFEKVLRKHPDARLVMAGDGYLKNTCTNLARFLKIEDKIDFCGIITPEQFRELLARSVALLQHSVVAENGDSEGTPLSVLEAGAAGLPVIGSRHAGIPDVVVHDQTGYVFEEHDVHTMAEQIIDLLDDLEKAQKMGENARVRIREKFSMDRHLNVLGNLISNALSD